MRVPSLFLLSVALASSASAQLFPPVPKVGTVYDGAHLLSTDDVRILNATSQEFKNREGAPIVVATLPSLESVGAEGIGIERYATALFDQWRIGHKERNVGILLLVAEADHKVRVELGKDLGHDYDAAVRRIQDSKILPAFKQGDDAGGIVSGVKALSHLPEAASSTTTPSSPSNVPMGNADASQSDPVEQVGPLMNPPSPSLSGGGLLCFIIPVVFFIVVIAAVSSRRRGYGGVRRFGPGLGPNSSTTYVNNGDDGFSQGLIAGQMMSQPTYDPAPTYDPGPSIDTSPSFDSGSSADSGGSSDSGSFDSGSSGGGGDTGSW